MPSFCAVFNCWNCAGREKHKSYYRFPSVIKNNGDEGLRLSEEWDVKSSSLKFSGNIELRES